MQNKPRLSFWQIWNMSFGFMGIQFGWGLQLANMSGIYTYLGANADAIPLLWLAGPVTGLLVQPIIGSMSDRTWNRLGRRRPYFLTGAILASIALFFMPDSPVLWVAAGLLWILDASINVSMEPFRAFVADKLNVDQRTAGFVMQSFFIGIGATLANILPYIFRRQGVDAQYQRLADAAKSAGQTFRDIPPSVVYSFKIGAAAFLVCVLWTVFTTKEYPPDDVAAFNEKKAEAKANRGLGNYVSRAIGIEKANFRSVGKLISILGAAFILTSFFMPWVALPNSTETLSGFALAKGALAPGISSGFTLWVIPIGALLVIMTVLSNTLSRSLHGKTRGLSAPLSLAVGVLSLLAVVYLIMQVWGTGLSYQLSIITSIAGSLILAFGWVTGQSEVYVAIRQMPPTMKQLAVVQFFTWLGLFCMWMFYGLMTSYHVFGAANSEDKLFKDGQAWGGIAFAVYSVTCFAVAFLLPPLAKKTSRKTVHVIALLCGAAGLLSAYFIQDKNILLITMVGVGIAWASILSMPYAILSGAIPPARMGVYMGIFNFFIVIPEIVASFTFGPVIRAIFGRDNPRAPLYVVMAGGVFMLIAAACVSFVKDVSDKIPVGRVLDADAHEPLIPSGTSQPVPSTGLIDG